MSVGVGGEDGVALRLEETELVLVTDTDADTVSLCVLRGVTRGDDDDDSELLADADADTLRVSKEAAGDDDSDVELDADTISVAAVDSVARIESEDKGDALSTTERDDCAVSVASALSDGIAVDVRAADGLPLIETFGDALLPREAVKKGEGVCDDTLVADGSCVPVFETEFRGETLGENVSDGDGDALLEATTDAVATAECEFDEEGAADTEERAEPDSAPLAVPFSGATVTLCENRVREMSGEDDGETSADLDGDVDPEEHADCDAVCDEKFECVASADDVDVDDRNAVAEPVVESDKDVVADIERGAEREAVAHAVS